MISNDDLVLELDRLDVPFLYSDAPSTQDEPIDGAAFLSSLAASDEARMRLAIIPLLLRHGEMAEYAPAATRGLSASARVVLMCYYTAATLLQQKHTQRLSRLGIPCSPLPDWFSVELGVPTIGDVDERLVILAQRQAALSSTEINWVGTYEHGATSFLKYYEHKIQWKQESAPTSFIAS